MTTAWKPFEARPHHVSGARRVAAPVSRTGVQAHELRPNKHSIHTQRVEDEKELCEKSRNDHT